MKQYALGFEKRGQRWKILRLRWLLAKIRPEIVHVHWAHFSYMVASACARPLVVTAWGSDIYRRFEQDKEIVGQLYHGLQTARLITCDSFDQRSLLATFPGVDEEKVHVVQWGVDTSVFRPGPVDGEILARLGVSNRPVVFSARKLFPIYNQEAIIAAFSLVRREIPEAVLLMKDYRSDADYVQRLRQHVEEHGLTDSVRIVDGVAYEQMGDLYRLAPVSVSVPFSDGTSMSVLEAMASGSAPIVSDLPSLKEWIRDGWNGYIVSPANAQMLAQRIVQLLKDDKLRETFAARNIEVIRERAEQSSEMREWKRSTGTRLSKRPN